MKNLLPKRKNESNKGTYGTVLNIAGSEKYCGAGILSSVAVLKIGAGKVVLGSEAAALQAAASYCPDIILLDREGLTKDNINDYDVYMIGCGLGQDKSAFEYFNKVLKMLKNTTKPVVIDADGLNILSQEQIELPKNAIMTPHPKEMSRLLGVSVEEILKNPIKAVEMAYQKYNCTVVLKLHNTLVYDGKDLYENNTGNSALAKGGSGDVLTGMIGGLLAQGLECFEAAKLGVYLHGLTGEIASRELTEYGVLASELLKYIPKSIKEILKLDFES